MDISDLNPADVLATLYNRAKPQELGLLHYEAELMTREEAQRLLDSGQQYFDYVKGRVMKIRLDGKGNLDTRLFNRDNGHYAAENTINTLRQAKLIQQGSKRCQNNQLNKQTMRSS